MRYTSYIPTALSDDEKAELIAALETMHDAR